MDIMTFPVPHNATNFFISWETVSFKRIPIHGCNYFIENYGSGDDDVLKDRGKG
jgi:hypothetical protein